MSSHSNGLDSPQVFKPFVVSIVEGCCWAINTARHLHHYYYYSPSPSATPTPVKNCNNATIVRILAQLQLSPQLLFSGQFTTHTALQGLCNFKVQVWHTYRPQVYYPPWVYFAQRPWKDVKRLVTKRTAMLDLAAVPPSSIESVQFNLNGTGLKEMDLQKHNEHQIPTIIVLI